MDNFKKKHGFSLPASRTPHDTTLGLLKRQLDSEQLAYIPLQKIKIFGDVSKPKSLDLSVNGQKVLTAESEDEPLKAHTFIRNLGVLMNGYALSGTITYQVAVDHTTFFEDKVFPQVASDRIPLVQAMSADEDLRRHWMAQVRTNQRTLAQAIEESRPMCLSLMTRQTAVAPPAVQPQGQKRQQQQHQNLHTGPKQPRFDQRTSKKPWSFVNPQSHKPICFNWNSGTCTKSDADCDREHACAVCFKKDCRATNHPTHFRPPLGGKGGRGKPGW